MEDINEEIYFLDNSEEPDKLQELNGSNTLLTINEKKKNIKNILSRKKKVDII